MAAVSLHGDGSASTEMKLAWIEDLQSPDPETRSRARAALLEEQDPRIAAPLMELIFFSREARPHAARILETLLDVSPDPKVHPYKFWLEEIGRREELVPIEGYLEIKASLYSRIDPELGRFLDPRHARTIRPEEIVFGGVPKDGIPALDEPDVVIPEEASWMRDDEIVFGLFVAGVARAYPRRILDWHEMANDVLGGTPVTLAWCTLCGAAIAYDGTAGERTFTFGTSGLLYRSNKLMYDRQTDTLWSQLSGEPVMGPLVGSGIALEKLPVIVTTWRDWRTIHPDTTVLSRATGFARDYDRPPYTEYFASDELMFPVWNRDDRLVRKAWVWTAAIDGAARAWPVERLQQNPLLNDTVGDRAVVLLTNPSSGGVRMYDRPRETTFTRIENGVVIAEDGRSFEITESALVAPDGSSHSRLPGHEAYWFAWSSQHPETTLFSPVQPIQTVE